MNRNYSTILRIGAGIGISIYLNLGFSAEASTFLENKVHSQNITTQPQQESTRTLVRWKHARELLGKYYRKSVVKSVVKSGEKIETLDRILNQWTHHALKGRWKKRSSEITKMIIHESNKYGFDPIFLMAVIRSESNFNPEVIGTSGEVGLMQITPQTAKWVTAKYEIPWKGIRSLKDPSTNIKIGAAYISYLRAKFDFRSQLYIAAYNMGSGNVQRAIARQEWPKKYPTRVMTNYVRFYSSLNSELRRQLN